MCSVCVFPLRCFAVRNALRGQQVAQALFIYIFTNLEQIASDGEGEGWPKVLHKSYAGIEVTLWGDRELRCAEKYFMYMAAYRAEKGEV